MRMSSSAKWSPLSQAAEGRRAWATNCSSEAAACPDQPWRWPRSFAAMAQTTGKTIASARSSIKPGGISKDAAPPVWGDTWTSTAMAAVAWPSPITPAATATVPKCQSLRQAKWLAERLERLLPTQYFHRVAISNHRLVSLNEGKVSFQAGDNSRPGGLVS